MSFRFCFVTSIKLYAYLERTGSPLPLPYTPLPVLCYTGLTNWHGQRQAADVLRLPARLPACLPARLRKGVGMPEALPWDLLLALALFDALFKEGSPVWQVTHTNIHIHIRTCRHTSKHISKHA